MALRIVAYRNITLLPEHERSDACYEEHILAFSYPSFPHSYRGLADPDHLFDMNGTHFIGGRCYMPGSEPYSFEAGSYIGYGMRRDALAWVFLETLSEIVYHNPDHYVDAPFFELINFADNEGCIGPEAAANLLIDFESGRNRWESEHPELLAWYDNWTTSCRIAADNGLIRFR